MIIYKVTNIINGKIYIGQTTQKISDRKSCHLRKAFKYNSQQNFHIDIREFGKCNFVWEKIDTAFSIKDLDDKEIYWINYYNSIDTTVGYNMRFGGKGGGFAEEVKIKIGLAGLGRKKSTKEIEEIKIRMTGKGNHFYGKKHSEITKRQISESRKGKGLGQTELQKLKCPHRGSSNGRAVIDENIARQIKIMLRDGIRNIDVQKHFKVSKSLVCGIKNNTSWKHIII